MHTICHRVRWAIPGIKDVAPLLVAAPRGLRRLPVGLFDTLLTWQERASQRHRLRHLGDRMLRDIGVSRADVERECRRPFLVAMMDGGSPNRLALAWTGDVS